MSSNESKKTEKSKATKIEKNLRLLGGVGTKHQWTRKRKHKIWNEFRNEQNFATTGE
jgi:hypothetical protein